MKYNVKKHLEMRVAVFFYEVPVTEKMFQRAIIERERRDPYINHHFEVEHFTSEERDIIGFLGEFACCELFDIDWEGNIRENYYSIDNGDIVLKKHVIDVKTETLPAELLMRLKCDTLDDDKPYGRRLINDEQVKLLPKYEAVVFGAFKREDCNGDRFPPLWYALGYASVKKDLSKYSVTKKTPFGRDYKVLFCFRFLFLPNKE